MAIYEYQATFLRAKDVWWTVGSCNFDHRGLRWNLEANQEIEDLAFAQRLASQFQEEAAASQRSSNHMAPAPLSQQGAAIRLRHNRQLAHILAVT